MTTKAPKVGAQRRPSERQEEKQSQLRKQLIEEALKQFASRGFDQVTVDDIIKNIDVSRRSFFRYFKSKDDLIFSWLDDMGDIIRPILCRRLITRNIITSLSEAFRHLARRLEENPDHPILLTKLIFSTPSLGARYIYEAMHWENEFVQIAEAINPSSVEDRYTCQVQSAFAVAAWISALREWVVCNRSRSLVDLVDSAFKILQRGDGAR